MLVPDQVRKSVLFIGTKENGKFRPRATAFIVHYQDQGYDSLQFVTAEHAISGLITKGHKIYGRFNLIGGDVLEIPIDNDTWIFYPKDDPLSDVAVCPFRPTTTTDTGETVTVEYQSISVNGAKSIAATEEIIKFNSIGVGEEIFIVGLFRSHYGHERNFPIIRVGNIAAMREEPVYTEYAGYIDAYLVEALSISGLSGSPVFVSMPPFRIINHAVTMTEGPQYYLLGLMHGHFDIKRLNEDTAVDDETQTTRGINTGIGIVIPVEKIIETIEHPDLVEIRSRLIKEHSANHGAVPD